ncbi:MAG: hypothetical protein ABL866_16675 [Devosia sp.]
MPTPRLTTTFTLTRADALAYERLPRPFRLGRFLLLVLWLIPGIAIPLLFAGSFGGFFNPGIWALAAIGAAIQYTLAMIWLSIGDLRRARRRLRVAADITIEEDETGFSVSGPGIPRYLTFAEAGRPKLTRDYLFLGSADNLVILPRRAFPEEGSFEALAARLTAAGITAAVVDPEPAPA